MDDDPEKQAKGKRRARTRPRRRVAAHHRRDASASCSNNIYGVDIDPQAVEVTKLSLLLKVLEGETGQTLDAASSRFFHERALPDLGDNIKCGNSLIGPVSTTASSWLARNEESATASTSSTGRPSSPRYSEGACRPRSGASTP